MSCMCNYGIFIFLLLVSSSLGQSTRHVVNTLNGPVSGVIFSSYRSYLGIPYAAPPVGSLRWQPPQPHADWQEPLDASVSGPGCPQSCDNPAATCPTVTSEDCLTLNVFAPASLPAPDQPLKPVMIFIHGGRFLSGYVGGQAYDSRFISNVSDTIVVAGNYRLGALGWLVTDQHSGNFGLLDQRMVLQWVQANIMQFGGDPKQVTIFGESAGASSVGLHMITQNSKGLFHAALMESNPLGLPLHDTVTGAALALVFAKDLGCSVALSPSTSSSNPEIRKFSIESSLLPLKFQSIFNRLDLSFESTGIDWVCLHRQSPDNIVVAQRKAGTHLDLKHTLQLFLPWAPVVDGAEIPCQPITCFEKMQVASPVPLVIGTNTEEARPFVYGAMDKNLPWYEYDALLAGIFGVSTSLQIHRLYPSNSSTDERDQLSALVTDMVFGCASRHLASVFTSGTSTPSYLYLFDHVASFDFWGPLFPYCPGHNCHGEELPFVFQSARLNSSLVMTADEIQLADAMDIYWGNFATFRQPNNPSNTSPVNPTWPQLTPSPNLGQSGPIMRLATPESGMITSYRDEFCALWDRLGYHWD